MMKLAWLDCGCGISGDMCLAALLDAGAPMEALERTVRGLGLRGVKLVRSTVKRSGLRATRLEVRLSTRQKSPARTLKDVEKIISSARLSDNVKARALGAFRRIFRAEAKVHGKSPGSAHLHELGAADALVDIAGSMALIEALGVDKVFATPPALGFGSVKTGHGILPLPAPATLELLKGMEVRPSPGNEPGELTTPTGAAILRELVSETGPMPAMKIAAIGIGAGRMEFKSWPNVLRVVTGESLAATDETSSVLVIEANIDDMSPEGWGYVFERLFESGALDAYLTPVLMKKSRPGMLLSVLCERAALGPVSEAVLTETTTIGLRYHDAQRITLSRAIRKVRTRYGAVRVKDVFMTGRLLRSAPEYEDCRAIARKKGVALIEVMRAAEAAALKR